MESPNNPMLTLGLTRCFGGSIVDKVKITVKTSDTCSTIQSPVIYPKHTIYNILFIYLYRWIKSQRVC
jgi:hypothetical protein